MRAGRSLLLAGRAAGRYRTPLRRTEAIGVHGKTRHTRREDLRQESQQENWKYQITPSTQRTPLPVFLSVRDEAGAIKRHELKSVPADKLGGLKIEVQHYFQKYSGLSWRGKFLRG